MEIPARGIFTPEDEYLEAIKQKILDHERGKYIAGYHWDLYLIPSFRTPVTEEFAREKGIALVHAVSPSAYAMVFWGKGGVTERMHLHVLVGGLNLGGRPRTGLNLKKLNLKRAIRLWRYGVMVKGELYDSRKGAAFYLPTHHDFDFVGECKRHRMRRGRPNPQNDR